MAKRASNHCLALILNFLFLLSGSTMGYFLSSKAQDKILDSILAFCAIVIGFVITAMLFSGRSQAAEHLSLEQAKTYVIKTKYILLSQIFTLISYLFCIAFTLLSIVIKNAEISFISSKILFCLSIGYFILGVYRILFLPFQIYDVHDFSLNSLIKEKEKSARAEAKSIVSGFTRIK